MKRLDAHGKHTMADVFDPALLLVCFPARASRWVSLIPILSLPSSKGAGPKVVCKLANVCSPATNVSLVTAGATCLNANVSTAQMSI
jgi:hypothetical protein